MDIKRAVCTAILLAVTVVPAAWGQTGAKRANGNAQPIEVDADRLDAFNDKHMVVFSGNVTASQEGRTIHAESLTIHYGDDRKTDGKSSFFSDKSGAIEKIVAKGQVRIVEGQRTATGNVAVFEQGSQKVTLTGDAVLKEGKNLIKGERIVIFLEENRGVVEKGENGRVTATIYPGEKNDGRP